MTTPDPSVSPWFALADLQAYAQVLEGAPDADVRLDAVRQGVAEFVERNRADLWSPAANDPERVFAPTPAVRQGAILLGARLIARRGAPLGLQSYGEFAASILRSDPDIGLMLGIGRNARPALG